MENNVYLPFKSKILKIVPYTGIDYTFRMEFKGDVKQGGFLKYLFRNMEKPLYP